MSSRARGATSQPTTVHEPGPRSLRADAAKNRARLLEAAEAVFAEEGVTAQVDRVAERAGVGVGTLYRHFPTKEVLIVEVIRARLEDLLTQAEEFEVDDDPGEAFTAFLVAFVRQAARKRDLFDALCDAGIDVKARCAESFTRLHGALETLLARAQDAGVVRRDVSADDVLGLVAGTCQAAAQNDAGPDRLLRMLAIVVDGLRNEARPI